MKITIPRSDLLQAVNKVKTVVSAKSALPILSHILLDASDASVKLSATDLKVSIENTVDCTVETPGQLTVSAQRLVSILSELPEKDITLELQDSNVVHLMCDRIETKLYSMSPDEFPPIRSFEGIEPLILPQNILKNIFTKTSFAISTDQARYNLTGLLLELEGGKLIAVSTDGRRMSLYSQNDNIPEGINIKVIIPGKMVHELERLLGDDGEVKAYIDENQAGFEFDNTRLVTALIEGTFPNYEMVVPKKHDKEAVVKTEPFAEAMRRTRTMTNDKFNSVRFLLTNGAMTLEVNTPEVGEYREDMPVEYEGEDIQVAFNPDFVLDVLKHVSTESSAFVLKDSVSPGVIKPYIDEPKNEYLNVIMPIRI